jgi:hypothetical protein
VKPRASDVPATTTAVRISTADLAAATDNLPARNTNTAATVTGKDGKRREVRGKCKRALDRMVWEGQPWDEAAKAENYTVASMRKALERPHVRAYLQEQKQVFRASASSQNISRLVKIRDQDENRMASLGAVKLLEEGSEIGGNDTPVRTPGISIQIINQVAADTRSGEK